MVDYHYSLFYIIISIIMVPNRGGLGEMTGQTDSGDAAKGRGSSEERWWRVQQYGDLKYGVRVGEHHTHCGWTSHSPAALTQPDTHSLSLFLASYLSYDVAYKLDESAGKATSSLLFEPDLQSTFGHTGRNSPKYFVSNQKENGPSLSEYSQTNRNTDVTVSYS